MTQFVFHGVNISFVAHDDLSESVLKLLVEDFRYFQGHSSKSAPLEFHLYNSPAPPTLRGVKFFKTRMCSVFGFGFRRICDYGDGTIVDSENWSHDRRRLNIYSSNEHELYEIAYVALLSVVGEALDHRAFHRVHALALSNSRSATMLLLPSGGGKSTLAATLLTSQLSLLSDESPLLKDGIVYPFPNHIAVAPDLAKDLGPIISQMTVGTRLFKRKRFPSKFVFSVPLHKVSEARPLEAVLIGKRWKGPSSIKKISFIKSLAPLLRSIVVGEGLAQMSEFMLRGNNIANILRIAFSRLTEAVRIMRRVQCYEFLIGSDRNEAARTLLEFAQLEKPLEASLAARKTRAEELGISL